MTNSSELTEATDARRHITGVLRMMPASARMLGSQLDATSTLAATWNRCTVHPDIEFRCAACPKCEPVGAASRASESSRVIEICAGVVRSERSDACSAQAPRHIAQNTEPRRPCSCPRPGIIHSDCPVHDEHAAVAKAEAQRFAPTDASLELVRQSDRRAREANDRIRALERDLVEAKRERDSVKVTLRHLLESAPGAGDSARLDAFQKLIAENAALRAMLIPAPDPSKCELVTDNDADDCPW